MIDLLLMIIGGAIIGWLGKKFARGDVRIPTWLTVACGIGGVLVGNFLYTLLFKDNTPASTGGGTPGRSSSRRSWSARRPASGRRPRVKA